MQSGMVPTQDNHIVLKKANTVINTWDERRIENSEKFRKTKQIIWMGDYYEKIRRKLIVEIINAEQNDPIRNICMHPDTLKLKE